MSVNDIMDMDLTPLIIIFLIAGVIFLIYCRYSIKEARAKYNSIEEKTEYDLKVVSKELGDKINIGGTVAAPIKGYRCTLAFERKDGSRLVLRTSKSEIYERIILNDVGTVKYKDNILTDFIHISQ